MERVRKTKIIALMMTAMFCGLSAYADTEEDLVLGVRALPTVSIEKSAESIESGSATPGTGVVSTNLQSVFTLQTTGTDSDYDFIITSSINIDGDTVSAYGKNESILFAHTTNPPTLDAVNNAKDWRTNNRNVIAYPLNVVVDSPMSVVHKPTHTTYGNCYVVKVNGSSGGNVTNIVTGTPISNTYDVTFDEAGSYQAVITFTAFGK